MSVGMASRSIWYEPENVEVTCTPGVMGELPCIGGTRVLAETIRQYLISGDTKSEIFADYPYLPVGSVEAVIRWCEANDLQCTSS
jgi:uncharacterized protein (DUF433 family)